MVTLLHRTFESIGVVLPPLAQEAECEGRSKEELSSDSIPSLPPASSAGTRVEEILLQNDRVSVYIVTK